MTESMTLERDRRRLVWGGALLLVGLAWLFETLGLLPGFRLGGLLAALLLAGGAALCWLSHATDPERRWGYLIPAGVLLGLAISVLGETVRVFPGALLMLLFFSAVAAAFVKIYLLNRQRLWALLGAWSLFTLGCTSFISIWGRCGSELAGAFFLWGCATPFAWYFLRSGREWALFPGGGLASLGFAALLEALRVPDSLQAAGLLLGFSATFWAYYLLGKPGRSAWARIPGAVLLLVALANAFSGVARPLLVYGVPLGLIGLGLYLILGTRR